MAPEGVAKLLYIVVVEDDAAAETKDSPSFRYTRSVLQSTLQLMGCKARHAFKDARVYPFRETARNVHACLDKEVVDHLSKADDKRKNKPFADDKSENKPFELYKRRTTLVVGRKFFLDVVCEALSEYKYVGPNQRADLVLACRIRERKESVTVLLCGTSGCGKSTLSALLGSRLGITTVISTDSIRHMMRSFVDEKQNPLLWASTYHAGEHLDPVAVAKAKAKKKAKKSDGVSAASLAKDEGFSNSTNGKSEGNTTTSDFISPKQMAVEGFKAQREHLYDPITNTVPLVDEEYRNQCTANSLSSKGMFQLIQRQGVAVDILDDNGKPIVGHPTGNGIGTPMYGPLQIGKAEPVNLQFGHFGISAWPGDTGGTSHASSVDESKGELTDNGSRYYSSCCSSPRISDGPAKELKEEQSVHGSDEEVDEPLEVDSDEDLSYGQKQLQEELEGSVDEESTKSDEEYDDLAMQDIPDSGYMCDDDEEFNNKMKSNDVLSVSRDQPNKNELHGEKNQQNLDLFHRTKSEPLSESFMRAFATPLRDKNDRRVVPPPGSYRLRRRSQSIHNV
ncbi:hypothetical protein DH2020_021196 [Rehmannia glutinosa]|uniref:Uncharacterized protein n=1 Tax=Rehmannia glutinosa TaxID=99300 RepID=A0ABR0WCQ0_REHGL